MKAIYIVAAALLSCGAPLAMCEETTPPPPPQQQTTVEDLNRQIEMTKEQIVKYKALAAHFNRHASELQSHDFSGARHAAMIRDEILSLNKDLQQRVLDLEKSRDELLASQGKDQK